MSFFAASPFLKALGWALLNSVWQFAILSFVYWILIAGIRKLTAAAKHSIALCLLFSGTVLFLTSLSWKYYSYPAFSTVSSGDSFVTANRNYYNLWHAAQQLTDSVMPYWSLLYIICVAGLFIKFCLFVQHANHLRANGVKKMTAGWRTYVTSAAVQLGIHKEVKAVLSLHVDTPQVIGFLKPVILVPLACLTHLTTEQLEAILLHELVHIKRNDYLVNLFVASAEILFFFNPFVKQLINAIRKEREYSCDDMVIQFQYQPGNYAAALLTLEKNRTMQITFGIAASGKNKKQLLTRIERIMAIKTKHPHFSNGAGYVAAALLIGFIAFVNPAKLAVDKFNTPIAQSRENNLNHTRTSQKRNEYFTNTSIKQPAISPSQNNAAPANLTTINKEEAVDEGQKEDLLATIAEGEGLTEETIQTAAAKEAMDFSLPENEVAAAPAPELSTVTPYIPSNSFSYQFIQDSNKLKAKGETYNEHVARETLAKTKKALETINWQKIEKDLKYNKLDLAKLKLEISAELSKLNWQQINKDVRLQGNLEQMNKIKDAVQQEQSIRIYQQNQAYFEALQKQLQVQEQVIKESDLQMQKTQKTLEKQQKKVQEEMKKRRMVYI